MLDELDDDELDDDELDDEVAPPPLSAKTRDQLLRLLDLLGCSDEVKRAKAALLIAQYVARDVGGWNTLIKPVDTPLPWETRRPCTRWAELPPDADGSPGYWRKLRGHTLIARECRSVVPGATQPYAVMPPERLNWWGSIDGVIPQVVCGRGWEPVLFHTSSHAMMDLDNWCPAKGGEFDAY